MLHGGCNRVKLPLRRPSPTQYAARSPAMAGTGAVASARNASTPDERHGNQGRVLWERFWGERADGCHRSLGSDALAFAAYQQGVSACSPMAVAVDSVFWGKPSGTTIDADV
jgi:hypothetical protein